MVDGDLARLVVSGLLGFGEIPDVPDVCHGEAVGRRANAVVLVVLVVQDEELLVLGVENPSLVGVACTGVAGTGDYGSILLVGHVVACKEVSIRGMEE